MFGNQRAALYDICGLFLLLVYANWNVALAEIIGDAANHVVINTYKGKPYYHLAFQLNSSNFNLPSTLNEAMIKRDGGQFEIYIRKEYFPVKATRCKSDIILRMPWTRPNLPNSDQFIEEKVDIYRSIKEVAEGKNQNVEVIIELNPYVQASDQASAELTLTQCNVFFRSNAGKYIPHTGNL